MRISRWWADGASGALDRRAVLLLLAGSAACGASTSTIEGPAPEAPPRTYAASQLFSVEAWGASPSDTTVPLSSALGRTIVLRHGPPDNTVYAEVDVPARALVSATGAPEVRLTIRPLPGVYGVTLESDASLSAPIRLTFKFPVHFAAPSDSRTKYPTDVRFEQALVIARAEGDGTQFQTLRSTRPASDNLQAMVSKLGRYQMVAPR